jgi:hypothetical protein
MTRVRQCPIRLRSEQPAQHISFDDQISGYMSPSTSVPSRADAAALEYELRSSGRRHPDTNVFRRLEQRLRKAGSVTITANVNADCPCSVWTPVHKDAITAAVGRDPWKISSHTARETIPMRAFEVLPYDQLNPYHYSRKSTFVSRGK